MHMRSPIPGPTVKEKSVSVRVLAAIWVDGKACEIGSKATMPASDAWALAASTPPSVAFIK
jgi:hypothetical protein